jgi:hypothetical protein
MATDSRDTMKVYVGKSENCPIQTAEFVEIEGTHYALLHVGANTGVQAVNAALTRMPERSVLVTEMAHESGDITVLCKMPCPPDVMLEALAANGHELQPEPPEKKAFNPWFWRGATSIVGQSLQIVSSLNTYDPKKIGDDGRPTNAPDGALLGFAVMNLAANACNMIFGSQHKPDVHQLKQLKESFNQQWQPYIITASGLPSVDEKAMQRRPTVPRSLGEKLYDFARSQSVTLGEVGLRMAGTTSLIFPITTWSTAIPMAMRGDFAGAYNFAINKDQTTLKAGVATMVGKISGLLATEQDPYNPEPKTALDIFRQDIAFKLSSLIEGGAAAYMMHDRFTNKYTTIGYKGRLDSPDFEPKGTLRRDWAGTMGNAAFIDGYIMRYFAKVGSLDVDMKELCAHISDGMAQLPKEMIPDALAATALGLKLHFHDKKDITASGIYTAVEQDLANQHQIFVAAIRHRGDMKQPHDRAPEANHLVEPHYQQRIDAPQTALTM